MTHSEQIAKELFAIINDGHKIRDQVPGINQYTNEGPFSKNMNPTEIKVGDRYWLDIADLMSHPPWIPIEITYVRSGVIFYKDITSFVNVKEEYMLKNCVAIQMGQLQPMEYVVEFENDYEQYMFKYVPLCPHTKIKYKLKNNKS